MTSHSEIVLTDVSKDFFENEKRKVLFSGINYSFFQGVSYAIAGTSGVGKSSLLYIIGLLDQPSFGKVEIKGLSGEKDSLGYVFQDHNLIEELSVLENIALAGILKKKNQEAVFKTAKLLLAEVSLLAYKDYFPNQLSGGQKQLVAILRALINEPRFLLADEPTGNLDEKTASIVIKILCRYQKKIGMGLIVCSHDPNLFESLDKIIHLENGALSF